MAVGRWHQCRWVCSGGDGRAGIGGKMRGPILNARACSTLCHLRTDLVNGIRNVWLGRLLIKGWEGRNWGKGSLVMLSFTEVICGVDPMFDVTDERMRALLMTNYNPEEEVTSEEEEKAEEKAAPK
uniref:Uncharacterized protein n=1 Tax=Chromera velia CCMP2878 TaxID=1169474 RepID=A0A0G4IAQ1_9ALVE|eukprot:Cvel_12503.t1-p1 / transcript=Cvel_12503.t1 / gene=Cvel_12503 / organism=Chromera_velia_CCMP2878 / gene_product=hypothetical protein / transcript_product=hypothetical protein / location=Cvel_scaffold820:37613-42816(-) / protein_length=125 / sequence_SO=supercontig / SO=protein_coding / is_pseudo=false